MADVVEVESTEFDDGSVGFWAHVTSKKTVRNSSGRLVVKQLHDVIFDNASSSVEEAEETLNEIAANGKVHRIPGPARQVTLSNGDEITVEFDDRFFAADEEIPTKTESQEQTPINTNEREPQLA